LRVIFTEKTKRSFPSKLMIISKSFVISLSVLKV